MIAANELRIGNWVSNGEKYYTVDINMLYDIATNENFPIYPIPLTPEILEKISGFEKQGDRKYYCRRLYLKMREHDLLISSERWDTITVLSYLHQLQNLYAVVRQIELQIKLPATV